MLISLSFLLLAGAAILFILSARHRPHGKRGHRPVSGIFLMSKTLNIGGVTTATVAYQDKAGAHVSVVGVPVWSVNDPAVASVTASSDGLTASVTGLTAGTATITVIAEGDPTAGVDTITLTGTVDVVDEASGGTLTFS